MSVQLKIIHLLDYCTSPRSWHFAFSVLKNEIYERLEGIIGTTLSIVTIEAFVLSIGVCKKEELLIFFLGN